MVRDHAHLLTELERVTWRRRRRRRAPRSASRSSTRGPRGSARGPGRGRGRSSAPCCLRRGSRASASARLTTVARTVIATSSRAAAPAATELRSWNAYVPTRYSVKAARRLSHCHIVGVPPPDTDRTSSPAASAPATAAVRNCTAPEATDTSGSPRTGARSGARSHRPARRRPPATARRRGRAPCRTRRARAARGRRPTRRRSTRRATARRRSRRTRPRAAAAPGGARASSRRRGCTGSAGRRSPQSAITSASPSF